jgi:2-keto-4-pentenoate hydratase/2-oxohepta-3-ene-1,7-dioic acid hydratase in catechol pathway
MRLCLFLLEEDNLIGFYDDQVVYPIDQAAQAYYDATGFELDLPDITDPLELLPPNGVFRESAKLLWEWIQSLEPEAKADISLQTDEVDLLIPITLPSKILLLAGNYAEHITEQGGLAAERDETFPYVFMKPSSTLNTHLAPVLIPLVSPDHVDWECELGVVIGEVCKGVSEEEALDYVAGYTVVNDITDRKYRPNPGRKTRERDKHFDWLHGKWHDTFLPVGPCILSAEDVDPQNLQISLRVNGEPKQDSSTSKMVFPVASIISFISQFITLEPGDLIATGTPSGVGNATGTYLKSGDEVEAEIEGIGVLISPIIHESEWLEAIESEE